MAHGALCESSHSLSFAYRLPRFACNVTTQQPRTRPHHSCRFARLARQRFRPAYVRLSDEVHVDVRVYKCRIHRQRFRSLRTLATRNLHETNPAYVRISVLHVVECASRNRGYPMRIHYVVTSLESGGAEFSIPDIAKVIRGLGHDFHVFALEPRDRLAELRLIDAGV